MDRTPLPPAAKILEHRGRRPAGRLSFKPEHLVFLLGFFLYLFTLSPGLLPADAGEYQVVGAVLGVAHPPGFALYTLLSWLASRLPGLAPAAAINGLSALLAALTLALLARGARQLAGSAWAGAGAALVLGLSTTFWAQATTANVRMLTAFATALALAAVIALGNGDLAGPRGPARSPSGPVALAALALGLGVSHHGSLIFIAGVLGLYVLWLRPGLLRRPWPLAWGLLPFLAWAYFPLRAGAFGAPPRLATPDGFLEHILARGFSGDILYFANAAALPERVRILADILRLQFTWPILGLILLGGLLCLRRRRQLGTVLWLACAAHVFISITYKSPQTVEYLLPAYVILALFAGCAFGEIARWATVYQVRRNVPPETTQPAAEEKSEIGDGAAEQSSAAPSLISAFPVCDSRTKESQKSGSAVGFANRTHQFPHMAGRLALIAAAVLGLGMQFAYTFPAFRALARDTSTRDYAARLLESAPPRAVVLASWHWATPLDYLQQVEGLRPDVEVRYVYPRGESLAQAWADEISASLPGQPVMVTSFFPEAYTALPYRFVPLGPAWEAQAGPLNAAPPGLSGARALGEWDFLGYRLEPAGDLAPGSTFELLAAWQAAGAQGDINFFVHLVGIDGQLYGQHDVSHAAEGAAPGEVFLDRYRLTIRPDALPGDYALVAGAYLPDGTRAAEMQLTTLSLAARQAPPATTHRLWPFGGGAGLAGYDLDHSLPAEPRLYLHWRLGQAPAEADAPEGALALPAGPGYVTTAHDLAPGQAARLPGGARAAADAGSLYLPFGGAVILTRASLWPGGRLQAGQSLTVDLEFMAARPLVEDLVVGVALSGQGWKVQSDGTPAGGAIPTLKWIPGARIHDRHTLEVPAQAQPGPARLTLTLYDAFTQQDLALLDPRLALEGPAAALAVVEIILP